jgi:penicillin V acylase-like amidase (Ntn superfamily)
MPSRCLGLAAVLALAFGLTRPAAACTRCLHRCVDDTVIVGRSMDWMEDPKSEIWVFPRGMKRQGAAGPESLEWTSQYGSLIVSFYGAASVDGMNEKGLVANTLYLAESDYGRPVTGRPTISIAAWAQYILDSYATVAEAVVALEKEPFTVVAPVLPNGSPGVGHVALSDPSGDSAILEYIAGKLVIHHGRQYTVMTNSPPFDQQLALNAYWKEIGGDVMLPGTSRASDRFARTSFYVTAIPREMTGQRSIAAVFGVIRGASVPLGIATPGQPNIASTIWRTVHDHGTRTVFFDSATSPTVFWLPLADLDFAAGSPVRRLPLADGQTYSGAATAALIETEPFTFLEAKPE